jgi:hypothetical protein
VGLSFTAYSAFITCSLLFNDTGIHGGGTTHTSDNYAASCLVVLGIMTATTLGMPMVLGSVTVMVLNSMAVAVVVLSSMTMAMTIVGGMTSVMVGGMAMVMVTMVAMVAMMTGN